MPLDPSQLDHTKGYLSVLEEVKKAEKLLGGSWAAGFLNSFVEHIKQIEAYYNSAFTLHPDPAIKVQCYHERLKVIQQALKYVHQLCASHRNNADHSNDMQNNSRSNENSFNMSSPDSGYNTSRRYSMDTDEGSPHKKCASKICSDSTAKASTNIKELNVMRLAQSSPSNISNDSSRAEVSTNHSANSISTVSQAETDNSNSSTSSDSGSEEDRESEESESSASISRQHTRPPPFKNKTKKVLERWYAKQKYVDSPTAEQIAREARITPAQVRKYFSNTRNREKQKKLQHEQALIGLRVPYYYPNMPGYQPHWPWIQP